MDFRPFSDGCEEGGICWLGKPSDFVCHCFVNRPGFYSDS